MNPETILWVGICASLILILLVALCWAGQCRRHSLDEFILRNPLPMPELAARKRLHSNFPTEDLVEAVHLLKETLPVLNACMVSYDRESDLQVRVRKFLTRLENSHGE